jgi:hypothetical protein
MGNFVNRLNYQLIKKGKGVKWHEKFNFTQNLHKKNLNPKVLKPNPPKISEQTTTIEKWTSISQNI